VVPSSSQSAATHVCSFGEHLGSTCGVILNLKNSIKCSSCNALFCKKHASSWHEKASWKCQKCRPSFRTKGRDHDPTDYSMPTEASSDFRGSQESPLLAHQAGIVIDGLKSSTKELKIHPLAQKGVSRQTRMDHLRMLNLIAEAPPEQRVWPIARVALDALERGRQKFKWGWSTMGTKMGRMESLLNRLPLFTEERLQPVKIRFHQEWKDAVTHVARLTAQFRATGLPSMSEDEMEKAIMTATSDDIKALLLLSWALVARCGDMSQVKTDCMLLSSPKSDGTMEIRVHFERGKVIGKIDPYSISTTIPKLWAPFLQTWYTSKKTVFLFQMNSAAERRKFLTSVRKHLRTIRDDLELRAVRRGAAQNMARNNVPLDVIRYFTRHKDISMLRRYLKFGQAESEETRKGAAAGRAVWSKSC